MAKCYIRVKTEEQLEAVIEWGRWDVLMIDAGLMKAAGLEHLMAGQTADPDQQTENLMAGQAAGREIYIDLPDVLRESRSEKNRQILEESSKYTGIVIKNIDELGMVLESGFKGKVIGDPFLYAFNNDALDQYLELLPGMMFIANDELTDRESAELKYGDRMIHKIYGYQQLMITAQCLSKNHTGCREKIISFKDDKGNAFYSMSNCDQCYSVIYNGRPTSMLDKESCLLLKHAAESEEKGDTGFLLSGSVASSTENGYSRNPQPGSAVTCGKNHNNMDLPGYEVNSVETGGCLLDFTIETGEQVRGILRGDEIKMFTRGHHYKETD